MKNDGSWWYDKTGAAGDTTDPSSNTDMISPAFWLVSGRELKITRSDDPQHTALLQTTDDCVGGQSFRSKITAMVTLDTEKSGQAVSVGGDARFNMEASTVQLPVFLRPVAMEISRVRKGLASGATGVQVMEL